MAFSPGPPRAKPACASSSIRAPRRRPRPSAHHRPRTVEVASPSASSRRSASCSPSSVTSRSATARPSWPSASRGARSRRCAHGSTCSRRAWTSAYPLPAVCARPVPGEPGSAPSRRSFRPPRSPTRLIGRTMARSIGRAGAVRGAPPRVSRRRSPGPRIRACPSCRLPSRRPPTRRPRSRSCRASCPWPTRCRWPKRPKRPRAQTRQKRWCRRPSPPPRRPPTLRPRPFPTRSPSANPNRRPSQSPSPSPSPNPSPNLGRNPRLSRRGHRLPRARPLRRARRPSRAWGPRSLRQSTSPLSRRLGTPTATPPTSRSPTGTRPKPTSLPPPSRFRLNHRPSRTSPATPTNRLRRRRRPCSG